MGKLGRVALVFALAAILAVSGKIAWVDAQSVGPGGVPGAGGGSSFICTAANNCAALNAANTFTANQAIANGDSLGFPGAANWTISQDSSGNLDIMEGVGGPYGGFVSYGAVGTAQCFVFAGNVYAGPGSVDTQLCRSNNSVIQFGNGANAVGGWLQLYAIGGGTATNTDLRGHLTLAAGTASYTFTEAYTVAPTCTASDTTSVAAVMVQATTKTLTLTGTGTDVVNYVCAD